MFNIFEYWMIIEYFIFVRLILMINRFEFSKLMTNNFIKNDVISFKPL